MPIYAYRCENCGFAKDVLQKMSDPLLTVCPNCGHDSFKKQVTAAGFQLKGSGWYVTDFRDKPTGATPPVRTESDGKSSDKSADAKPDAAVPVSATAPAASSSDAKPSASSAPAPSVKSDKPSSTS